MKLVFYFSKDAFFIDGKQKRAVKTAPLYLSNNTLYINIHIHSLFPMAYTGVEAHCSHLRHRPLQDCCPD